MTTKQIDIKLFVDKAATKVFKLANSDGSVYDMTGSTIKCNLYLTSTPVEIACTVELITGKISVPFTGTHTDDLGFYEYCLIETKAGPIEIDLIRGNVSVIPYIPFTETLESFLETELPNNLTLSEDFRNQKILYWKRFLQDAFVIAEADLYNDSAWAVLQKALIAKLVIYDALLLCTKGSYIAFAGGDYTMEAGESMGGPIKKIETGPSNVEFHSTADAISKIFQMNAQGYSPWDKMVEDTCGLASKLRVKLPMCKDTSWKNPFVPIYVQNPDWAYPHFGDEESVAGQGYFEDLNITIP